MAPYRLRTRIFMVLYCLVFAWTVWPIGSVLVTDAIAVSLHCKLSEGGPQPCSLLGIDISHQLYVGGVSFWFALATFPTGVPVLLLLAALHIFLWINGKVVERARQ
jgi:hypothetical protein